MSVYLVRHAERGVRHPGERGASRYFDEVVRPATRMETSLVVSRGNVTKCLIAHCVGRPGEIIPEVPMGTGW
jgi:broad specificity phosphatase PhoE